MRGLRLRLRIRARFTSGGPAACVLQKDIRYAGHRAFPPDALDDVGTQRIAPYQHGRPNPFVLDTRLVQRAFFSGESPAVATLDATHTFCGTTGCDDAVLGVANQPERVSFGDFARAGVRCNQDAELLNSRNRATADSRDGGRYVEARDRPALAGRPHRGALQGDRQAAGRPRRDAPDGSHVATGRVTVAR